MNQETKYTNDGKKVIVVGKLNSQETIVQEIFISNGNEIPSGENFVVKSLHDAPAVSWKESKLLELEKRFDKEQREWDVKISDLKKKSREISEKIQAKMNYAGAVLKNLSEESFNTICSFLKGEIKWLIVNPAYSDPEIVQYDSAHMTSEYSENKLRLLSLFGEDDGTMTYFIGNYADYSGSKTEIIPFATYEDAVLALKEIINNKEKVTQNNIDTAKKLGFELDKEKVDKFYQTARKNMQATLDDYTKKAAEIKSKIDSLPK